MLIKKPSDTRSSEITPQASYLNRRNFMRAGVLAGSTLATGFIYRKLNRVGSGGAVGRELAAIVRAGTATTSPIASGFVTDESKTSFSAITHYNNFYEFSTDKEAVAEIAANFIGRPWMVEVSGACAKPTTFDLDDLLKISPPEERLYRMR